MKYLNKNIVSFLFSSVFLVQSCFAVAQDSESESNWRFSLVSDFTKAKEPVRFRSKTITLKTGSIGLQGNYDLGEAGEVFVRYGMGYSPSETLLYREGTSFESTINGSITAESYEYGYIYPYDIANSSFSLDFKISKTVNQHTGDGLTGFKLSTNEDLIANINSENNFTRSSVGLNYQLNKDTVLTAGIGRYKWSISAELKAGVVKPNGSIEWTPEPIKVNPNDPDDGAKGSDGFYFLEATFPLMDKVANIGVRRSQFNTTTENTLNEIYGGISIQF